MTAKIKAGSPRARLAEAMAQVFTTPAGKVLREACRDVIEEDFSVDASGQTVTTEELWRRVGHRQFAIQLVAAGAVDIHHIEGRQETNGSSSE